MKTENQLRKHINFLEVSHRRALKIKDTLEKLTNCADRNNYYYTKADVKELFADIEKCLQDSKREFFEVIEKADSRKVQRASLDIERKMKIGAYVQKTFQEFSDKNLLNDEEILNLQDLNYTKEIFGVNSFPILRKSRGRESDYTDEHGYNRYYKKKKYFDKYLLVSQWNRKHWTKFLAWESKMRQ